MKKQRKVYVNKRTGKKVYGGAPKRENNPRLVFGLLTVVLILALTAGIILIGKLYKDGDIGGGKSSVAELSGFFNSSDGGGIESEESNGDFGSSYQPESGDDSDISQGSLSAKSENLSSTADGITPLPSLPPGNLNFGTKNIFLQTPGFNTGLIMRSIVEKSRPKYWNLTSVIYKSRSAISSYNRTNPISLLDPYEYSSVAGVLTFRGTNFRNGPSFGYTSMKERKLEQIWERSVGGLPSSRWSWSWSGTGWTGQPVMIQWDKETREMMNIEPSKKNKENLVEVISATMDGHIYFYDLQDGKQTRPPIRTGIVVKGTPAVDPRGFPLLYVGQGDYPPKNSSNVLGGKMGFRIFNLIDQSLLYFHNTASDSLSHRSSWGALDSSPIIDGKSDTLVYPCENGMIYTAKLNTNFDKGNKKITINPEFVDYKYTSSATPSQGIESSMAIYGSYGYFSDNSGTINCVDLNTMTPVWLRRLEDDSDVTPVLQQEGDNLYLYCGTEVDDQKKISGVYKGEAFVYKFDALTGDIIWRNSYPAYTYNDVKRPGNDINGGIMGTFALGKGRYDKMIFVSVCMTEGHMKGNTLAAFDTRTGDLIWDYKMNHYSWGSPVDVYDQSGKLYILMTDSVSQVHLVDGDTGKRLDFIQLYHGFNGSNPRSGGNIESSAAVFGDYLVIGTRGGLIAGVRLR